MNREKIYLDNAAKYFMQALKNLDWAYESIATAYDGNEPGYPAPDSLDARAWDYLYGIQACQRTLKIRLNTWDEGGYDE